MCSFISDIHSDSDSDIYSDSDIQSLLTQYMFRYFVSSVQIFRVGFRFGFMCRVKCSDLVIEINSYLSTKKCVNKIVNHAKHL